MTDTTARSRQIVAELNADFTGNDHHLASEYEWRATVELLAWIHDHGDTFDPDELQQRSLQDGWSPRGARKLMQIAQNIITSGCAEAAWHASTFARSPTVLTSWQRGSGRSATEALPPTGRSSAMRPIVCLPS